MLFHSYIIHHQVRNGVLVAGGTIPLNATSQVAKMPQDRKHARGVGIADLT